MRGSSELEFCIIVHLVHLQSFILISYIISVLSIRPLKSTQKILNWLFNSKKILNWLFNPKQVSFSFSFSLETENLSVTHVF